MKLVIEIGLALLGAISAIIAIVGAFPTQMSTEQQIQLGLGALGWFIALCFAIAFFLGKRRQVRIKEEHEVNVSALASQHTAQLKNLKTQHAVEKTALERDLAKGYEDFLASELTKSSTALLYTSKLLSPESPIPRATTPAEGTSDEV